MVEDNDLSKEMEFDEFEEINNHYNEGLEEEAATFTWDDEEIRACSHFGITMVTKTKRW